MSLNLGHSQSKKVKNEPIKSKVGTESTGYFVGQSDPMERIGDNNFPNFSNL